MSRTIVETLVGAAVLVVAAGFASYAFNSTHMNTRGSYPISATFDNIDGISIGSDVRIGGVKVGVVNEVKLDEQSYRAQLFLAMKDDVKVPDDSTAAIVSEGLLGGKYVALNPGGSEEMLDKGGHISFTQSSMNLESLIGQFIFGDKDKDDDGKKSKKAAAGGPSALPQSSNHAGEAPAAAAAAASGPGDVDLGL
ncbi:outer membrane lipid asymmetry maintenance protein MlaD [bacterium]|nr:outer membrane lipid asymmetry maintenance protein MlaD [bacterium]